MTQQLRLQLQLHINIINTLNKIFNLIYIPFILFLRFTLLDGTIFNTFIILPLTIIIVLIEVFLKRKRTTIRTIRGGSLEEVEELFTFVVLCGIECLLLLIIVVLIIVVILSDSFYYYYPPIDLIMNSLMFILVCVQFVYNTFVTILLFFFY